MSGSLESREDLLNAAAEAGFPMSPSQLGRLYRAGLIPAPKVRALGRGRGSESRYPAGTATRLVRVAKARAQTHRLTDVAWRLWWEDGGEMPRLAREQLQDAAAALDAQRDHLASLLIGDRSGSSEGEAGIDKLYSDAEHGRLLVPLAEVRRNVGRERFATLVHALAAAAAGQPLPVGADDDPDIGVLVDRAFGVEPVQTEGTVGAPGESISEPTDFATLATILSARSAAQLADSDDDELNLARLDVRSLVTLAGAIAPVFEQLHGRSALGFGTVGRLLALDGAEFQMMLLLSALALRRNPVLRAGLEEIRRVLAPQAVAVAQLHGVITELREHVPALADVMSDQRLAAAQRDSRAATVLNAEIAQVRENNARELQGFFAARPNVDQLLATVQQLSDKDAE